MVGLSIVLETFENSEETKNCPQVINKATMFKLCPLSCHRVTPVVGFLERCFLCNRRLLEGKDIYMYKGDRAFCSVECRGNQILMDEGEISNTAKACFERERCSVAAIKGAKSSSQSSSLSSSSSRNDQKSASNKNGANCFVF